MGKGIVNFIRPAAAEKKKKRKTKPKPKAAKATQDIKVDNINIDPSVFSLSPMVDGVGIHVITRYIGQPVNICTLPAAHYDSWLRSTQQHRNSYVFSRTNVTTEARIKQMLVSRTVEIINGIFTRA